MNLWYSKFLASMVGCSTYLRAKDYEEENKSIVDILGSIVSIKISYSNLMLGWNLDYHVIQ